MTEELPTAEELVTKPKRKIRFGEDQMTLGDMMEFEEITGSSFSDNMRRVKVIDPETGTQAVDPDPEAKGRGLWNYEMSMKGIAAIIYMALKKDDPTITFDQVKQMNMNEFELVAKEDPTAAEVSDPPSETSA